ncbi:MAG: alpha-ribazole phosphatase family protein [Panacagrimonas sp.]
MTRLFLIRHPPVAMPPGICFGRSDVPALEWPEANVDALRAKLPPESQFLSSPLSRCRTLAESLAQQAERVRLDARLQEIDFGEWELRRFDSIDRSLIDAWAARPWDFVPPGGESAQAMSGRVLEALDDMLRDAPDSLVLVSHGGPLRVVLGTLLRLPRTQWLDQACEPGSIKCLRLSASRFAIEIDH